MNNMTNTNQLEGIFKIIAKRVIERKGSLSEIGKYYNLGIEAWLKVEAVAALRDIVTEVRNRGADLLLRGGINVELKAATTFGPSYIAKEGALRYKAPCIFLAIIKNRYSIDKFKAMENIELVSYEFFNDGDREWIIGMIRPLS